jgi:prepilin-type N-terminal cleavage/methylation domain-containing protein
MNIYKTTLYNKSAGFSLVETLVSIAIFAVISVLMSNIVIGMSRFSLDNERRSDFLSQLDNAANIIKNDLRGAQSMGICYSSTASVLYRNSTVDVNNTIKKLGLQVVNNTLQWAEMSPSGCTFRTDVTPPLPIKTNLSSSDTIKIDSLKLARADDSNATNPNTIVYIRIQACDSDLISTKKKIFDCTNNPYKYIFSITSRNVQS